MIVKTKLTKEEYRSASLATLWAKGTFKIIAIVYCVVILINIITSTNQAKSILPLIIPPVIIVGLVYFLFTFSLNRAYKNNPRVNEDIAYQFDNSGITITGETFKSEFSWEKLHKVTKTKKWLLLWHSNQIANAIPLDRLQTGMLEDLKNMVASHKVTNNL